MKALILIFLTVSVAAAFPPAPHHTLFGVVKNHIGTPLGTGGSTIILSGPNGEVLRGPIDTGVAPGMNYMLQVAQDADKVSQLYRPTAMLPTSPFTIQVIIGQTSYVPIQMQGQVRVLGDSGKSTRLDLTLGVDSDGDGLPDAWEQDMIDFDPSDGINNLGDVRPGDDTDGDGMTNLAEYIAGTYPFEKTDALRLEIKEVVDGVAKFEFVMITGRTYRITGSVDGKTWTNESVTIGEDSVAYHLADSITVAHASVEVGENTNKLFKLHVE
jgi:hypothetical protein